MCLGDLTAGHKTTEAMQSPDEEPMLQVQLAGKHIQTMADSGAAYTCLGPSNARHFPMSRQFVKTIGFSGKKQLIPVSEPVLCWSLTQQQSI